MKILRKVLTYKPARLGALLNYNQPWTDIPYFALDGLTIPLIEGETQTIYGDELINVPIVNYLHVIYTCAIGTQSGNNLVLTTPVAGSYSCTINIKNGTKLIGEYTITLSVVPLSLTGTKNILMIGDSLMGAGADYYRTKIEALLPNNTLTFLGTQGTTTKHEGYAGWAYPSFQIEGSPFYKDGAIDIAAYFTDNSIAIPDYVYIMLGINDTFSHCAIAGDGLTDAEVSAMMDNAKHLILPFLNFNPALKIFLGLPTVTENTGAGWNNSYDESVYSQDLFIQNINKYRKKIETTFGGFAYNSRVYVSYGSYFLDRNDGYPKTEGIHTNGVHLAQSGYEQIGAGIAATLNKKLNEEYSFTLTSTGTGEGVSTLRIVASADITLHLTGTAKFYDDLAATTNENNDRLVVAGALRVFYIKCPSGTASLVVSDISKITSLGEWTSGTNAASISGDVSKLINNTTMYVSGKNTLSGSITNSKITYYYVGGNPTITGDISTLTDMTYFGNLYAGAVFTGSIAGLTKLYYFYCEPGTSTITFPNVTNLKNLCYLYVPTNIILTSENVNQILADVVLNKDESKSGTTLRTISLTSNAASGAPTGQGLVDKEFLQGYRSPNNNGAYNLWTINTR